MLKNYNEIVGARRDEDGYLWVTGRMDDMLNVSGHLLSTAEVESALVEHADVAEAAVVSHPHAVKGECLYCFITPNEGAPFTPKLVAELRKKGKLKYRHKNSMPKISLFKVRIIQILFFG